jgi:hypothetical protein
MKTDKQFINTLEDNIRHRGAPTKLISDSAKVEISQKVKDILHALCISNGRVNPTSSNRTLQSIGTRPSSPSPTLSFIALAPLHPSGFSA